MFVRPRFAACSLALLLVAGARPLRADGPDASSDLVGAPVAAGDLRAPTAVAHFGVYHLSTPKQSPVELARKLLRDAGFAVDEPSARRDQPSAFVQAGELDDYPPPDAQRLVYRGRHLDDADKPRIVHPAAVTVLELRLPRAQGYASYRAALAALRTLARQSDGVLFDVATRQHPDGTLEGNETSAII